MGNVAETIVQRYQFGFETSPGVPAAAGAKYQLASLMFEFGDEIDVKKIKAQGHRHPNKTGREKAWSSFSVSTTDGGPTYTELDMLFDMIFGTATPTDVFAGSIAKKRVWAPALTGKLTPRTAQCQWGDASDNVNEALYALLTDCGLKYDREKGIELSGVAGIARKKANGATFTASPTTLTNADMLGEQLQYYLDTTGAGVGTTQVTDEILDAEWGYKGVYAPRWAADRTQASYKAHVNKEPELTLKLQVAESAWARTLESDLDGGATRFLRIETVGQQIEPDSGNGATNFTHQVDVACQMLKKGKYGDAGGIYMREFELQIVEDATWAKAFQITNITDTAAL